MSALSLSLSLSPSLARSLSRSLADAHNADDARASEGVFSCGMQATLTSAPAGHTHSTLVVTGSSVKDAMGRWGDMMLLSAGGGKERTMKWTLQGDAGLRQLSYYTDNGAYYYYHTQDGTCTQPNSTACCEGRCSGGHHPPASPYVR